MYNLLIADISITIYLTLKDNDSWSLPLSHEIEHRCLLFSVETQTILIYRA